MGYDMHTVIKPEGEERAVSRAREAWEKAIAERDAFPREAFGKQDIHNFDIGYGVGADPECAAACDRANELYRTMRRVERSYFRLNIWGMGRFRSAMLALGMAYAPIDGDYTWPVIPGGHEGTAGHVAEALSEDSIYANDDPRDLIRVDRTPEQSDAEWAEVYWARYYPEETWTQADIDAATLYDRECAELLKRHPAGGSAIPLHKLGSNDGWLVTPAECLEALGAWHARTEGERDDALQSAGIDRNDPDWADLWKRWLEFLELAAHCDGFEVH
jgi:hypothetical protein